MGRQFPLRRLAAAALAIGLLLEAGPVSAAPSVQTSESKGAAVRSAKQTFVERRALFDKVSALTGIPWYDLAAMDQYERTINLAKKRLVHRELIAVYYSDLDWTGLMNPDHDDTNVQTISFFGGQGTDGDGDGRADRNNDADALNTMARFLLKYGVNVDDFRIGLWEYYHNTKAVERIEQFSRIYAAFDSLELHEHTFPLPLGANYSFRSTWGASRGWGGYRIHEGTDLFAGYGIPVRSTAYGIIEVMGWNPYGGWRVGIRDLNNVYHYYAHLSGFNKQVKPGDIVKPGQVVGWVGSSGYGKPGTSGKFPPHLHYGLYRDNGQSEWSFDPYPHLRKWEREERQRMLQGRKK